MTDLESGRRLPKGGPHPPMPRMRDGIQALGRWLELYAVSVEVRGLPNGAEVERYSLGFMTPAEWVVVRNESDHVTSIEWPDWYPGR